MSETKKDEKPTWIPLESNPEAFNKYIQKLGVKGVECGELFGFDDDLLLFVPGPHLALIFCYPCSKEATNYMEGIYTDLLAKEKNNVPEGTFFMKQKIHNACGTFSLLHALTNNSSRIDIGNGPFASWYNEAKSLGVQERSDHLAKNSAMADAHQRCAEQGETEAPQADKVEFHFISYINKDGHLYEFDSAQNFPRNCGLTKDETFLKDAGAICQQLMHHLGNISCCAIAMTGKIDA